MGATLGWVKELKENQSGRVTPHKKAWGRAEKAQSLQRGRGRQGGLGSAEGGKLDSKKLGRGIMVQKGPPAPRDPRVPMNRLQKRAP